MIYQGDIGIHDIKVGNIDVFEIYQGTKLVYPYNNTVTITFNLNVSGTVTINGYTPVISENNTKFVFTLPVKTDYTATIEAEHYQPKTINENSGYLPITHDVELQWKIKHDVYTVTFPDNGVKVLFDGVEKGVIASHGLVVLVDDRYSKDSYVVTFEGTKDSIYTVDELTVDDINVPNSGGTYDLTSSTSAVKTNYKRKDYSPSTGSVSKGSTYNGYWIETVVNLIASFTVQTTLGIITNKVLTIGNNESTTAKSGTLTVNYTLESGTRTVTANIAQVAGAKVYTDWVLDLQTDGTTVNASGGTRTVTANVARRTYKWNNTGTVYSETATPTLSISGSASLSGDKINFTSNESVSARTATLTSSHAGLTKSITITQQAGAKVYSAWSAWAVSISASPQTIGASGGSSTITANASRSRTWTWNGVGTTYTDTETAVPTLSGSAGGFTLSGTTVTASNNTTTNSRSITITATSNSVSKTITITQSAGAKVYGNWSGWTINLSTDKTTIGATGGTATVSTSATRTRSYTWNGVAGSGGTETGNGSPTLSKVSGSGSWTSPKVTYGNNTSTSSKSTVIRATIDSTTKDITITQSAGSKNYGSWSSWSVSCSASSYSIDASGGSVTIYRSASRSRTWTWNGVAGSGGTEYDSATPSISVTSGSGSLSGITLSYGNNTSTSSRTTRVTADYNGYTDYCDITQSAGSKTYGSWSAWTVNISASSTNIAATGGNSTITCSASRSRSYQWNGTGTNYTETENGNPTLSKSGDGTLSGTSSGSKLTYDNRTAESARSTTVTATYSGASKSIIITQSAGAKVYNGGEWTIYYSTNYSSSNPTWKTDPYNFEVEYDVLYTIVALQVRRTETYTWNGIGTSYTGNTYYKVASQLSGTNSGFSAYTYSNASNNVIVLNLSLTKNINSFNKTLSFTVSTNNYNNTAQITWRCTCTQQSAPKLGRLVIGNASVTANDEAIDVYFNGDKVDTIFNDENSYQDIKQSANTVEFLLDKYWRLNYDSYLLLSYEGPNGDTDYSPALGNIKITSNYFDVYNSTYLVYIKFQATTISTTDIVCSFTVIYNNITFDVTIRFK